MLKVKIHANRVALGNAAGEAAAAALRDLLRQQDSVAIVFAAAPSQNETHAALREATGIDWGRITALHMDEYAGISSGHPASFRHFLHSSLFDHLRVRAFHEIAGDAPDVAGECERYAELLRSAGPALCILGIGENGHLAFNDPPADFNDSMDVKLVNLDLVCREQQVHDGCFKNLDEVPRQAITLTVPALMRIPKLILAVPGATKAEAVRAALEGPVTPNCPASVLREHPDATLFLDSDSAALLAGRG